MTVNDGELETDLPIALFASTIPAVCGSLICLILMCWSACPQVHMGNYLLSEPPSCSSMLRFMGRLHLGRVRTGEECVFLSPGVGSDEAHPLSLSGHADRRLPCSCFYSGEKVQTRCEVLFRVIVALTGEWAVKPRGHRFMDHLVLSKVKGQGCTTCPPQYSTVGGGP